MTRLYMETTDINIVLLSSLVFLTNALAAIYKKYYIYGGGFMLLTISSLLYHSYGNVYTNVLDKLCILGIVLYGAYLLYIKSTPENNLHTMGIVTSFITVLFLFFYGYGVDNYCFHPDHGNHYHGLLHLLSSLGHHWIIFL